MCLHEGNRGRSIDPIFIRSLIRSLAPNWIRHWDGNNAIRTVDKGGRSRLVSSLADEIKVGRNVGSSLTIMVWADLDHDIGDGGALKEVFWSQCKEQGITKEEFDQVVFVFAKDRLENWIEFLLSGKTDESREGPRVKDNRSVREAAKRLAEACKSNKKMADCPPSLAWSCKNWHALVDNMR